MRLASLVLACVFCSAALTGEYKASTQKPPVLMDGLGSIHHPVSTKNADAQKFYDQGLRLIYAFNHDEARRAFERASELDPNLGMAFWGISLALGSNYNLDAEEEPLKDAFTNLQKARAMVKDGIPYEKAYIDALSKRYVAEPSKGDKKKLARDYSAAMKSLMQRYPDDLDAATLYAESLMNQRPWDLWTKDGKPAPGTEEIISVLESVLRRNPEHTGANHYLIHALEASPNPERALAAADRLKTLAPRAGHLVHMPSHIYIRIGDFESAALSNEKAAAVDHAYITKNSVTGVYSMMYYSHNLHFLAVAHAMQGRFAEAKEAADKLAAHVGPHVKDMADLQVFLPTPTLVQIRFNRWDDILASKAPDDKLTIAKSIWHYARGLALNATGKSDEAKVELAALQQLIQGIPEKLKFSDRNLAKKVLAVPALALEAKITASQKDIPTAITLFEKAIQAEDDLNYIEPADWYLSVRESLGALYLKSGKGADAERVFRADLARNRRNPRSLFGLMESLKAQGKTHDAQFVQQEFQAAWRNAEGAKLRIEDF